MDAGRHTNIVRVSYSGAEMALMGVLKYNKKS